MTSKELKLRKNLAHLRKMYEVGSRWVKFLQDTEPESIFTQKEAYRLRLIQQSIRDCIHRIDDPKKREFIIEYYANLTDYRKGLKSKAAVISTSYMSATKLLRKKLGRIYITDKPYL